MLLSACHCPSLFSQSPQTGTLQIRFTHIRTEKGSIAIGINTGAKGWPRKAQFEFQFEKKEMKDGVFEVQVPELPFGTLAISVLDDEDSNRKMAMSITGPKEGYGFSRDAALRVGPPKFEDCSFEFTRNQQQISIQLKYAGKDK